MLTIEQGTITYRERPLSWLLRAFIAVLALGVGIGIPATWLANVGPATSLTVLALVALVVIVCVGFAAFMVLLLLASTTELWIDPSKASVTRIRRGPIRNDTTLIPRDSFGPPVVTMRDSEDGPFPILRLPLADRKRIEMTCFDSRAEAEAWRDVIAAALSAPGR